MIFATNLTQEEANRMEELLIALYETTDPNKGYNIKKGGNNHSLSEATKEKISIAAQNRNEEWREKQRGAHLGIKYPEEVCRKHWKAVYCVETRTTYESQTKAAQALGLR